MENLLELLYKALCKDEETFCCRPKFSKHPNCGREKRVCVLSFKRHMFVWSLMEITVDTILNSSL